MKTALTAEGYRDEVDKYAGMNELAGAATLPTSFGFFYERPGAMQLLGIYISFLIRASTAQSA
jgi:hypothetical protein